MDHNTAAATKRNDWTKEQRAYAHYAKGLPLPQAAHLALVDTYGGQPTREDVDAFIAKLAEPTPDAKQGGGLPISLADAVWLLEADADNESIMSYEYGDECIENCYDDHDECQCWDGLTRDDLDTLRDDLENGQPYHYASNELWNGTEDMNSETGSRAVEPIPAPAATDPNDAISNALYDAAERGDFQGFMEAAGDGDPAAYL